MPDTEKPKTHEELERETLDEIRRADAGEEPILSEVRERLNSKPEFWKLVFGVARRAESSLIDATAGDGRLRQEAHRRELAEMKGRLAEPDCGPLERLLADRVAVCWLQVQHADTVYYSNMPGVDLAVGEYYQRRQDRAHRRLLAAVKALVTVRKLALPALQVNIADQQVNLTG